MFYIFLKRLLLYIKFNYNYKYGTGYTGLHYMYTSINFMLYVCMVPNTEAALPCCSAMDTLWRRNGGTSDHVSCSADAC